MTTDKPVTVDANVAKELTAIIAEIKTTQTIYPAGFTSYKTALAEIANGIININKKQPSIPEANNNLGRARDDLKFSVIALTTAAEDKENSKEDRDAATKARDATAKLQARLQTVINKINKVGEKTNQDSKPEGEKKAEITDIVTGNTDLPSESWGVKFVRTVEAAGIVKTTKVKRPDGTEVEAEYKDLSPTQGAWYLSLLPAMKSNLPLQGGMDTPGAMPGLNFRVASNVIKHKVIGFHPVYQHLGVDTISCVMVGCFTGADGTAPKTFKADDAYKRRNTYTSNALVLEGRSIDDWAGGMAAQYDSFRDFQSFYKFAVQSGAELEVEINVARNAKVAGGGDEDGPFRDGTSGNPKFKGFVKNVNTYYARTDRTWYVIEVEITDAGLKNKDCINLTNDIEKQIEKITPAQEAAATPAAEVKGEDYAKCLDEHNMTKRYKLDTVRDTGGNVAATTTSTFLFNTLTAEGVLSTCVGGSCTYGPVLSPKEAVLKLIDINLNSGLFKARRETLSVIAQTLRSTVKIAPLGKEPVNTKEQPFRDYDNTVSVVDNGILGVSFEGGKPRFDEILIHKSGWGIRKTTLGGINNYGYQVISPATALKEILSNRNVKTLEDIKTFLQYNTLVPNTPAITCKTANPAPTPPVNPSLPNPTSIINAEDKKLAQKGARK